MQSDAQSTLLMRSAAVRAEKTGAAIPCRFISIAQTAEARAIARENSVTVSFSGGWDSAESMQVCFHPAEAEPVFTAQWVHIGWNGKFQTVTHRDLLGSLMALGTDRSWFGDLLIQDSEAFLYALPALAQRLPQEWTQAGRASIRVELMDTPPMLRAPVGEHSRVTVPSPRLDALLSAGLRLSRARASELVRAGHVAVNHADELRTDRMLSPGDLISIRGFGRVRVLEIGPPNRKERYPAELEIFSSKGRA